MSRKNWAKVADEQFNQLPKDYQEDWKSLRNRVKKR
jgi:DNA-binding ferritin-like protein (Dps family)